MVSEPQPRRCIAFRGSDPVAAGELLQVALAVKALRDSGEGAPVLVFDAVTSEPIELNLRGTLEEVQQRYTDARSPALRSPGRPRLGVIAREVTLLPRHWEWLSSQPGGASVALRRLVDAARRTNELRDRVRQGQETTYRFIAATAGDEPGFEEAARALFSGNAARFAELVEPWPAAIRAHATELAMAAFMEQVPDDGLTCSLSGEADSES